MVTIVISWSAGLLFACGAARLPAPGYTGQPTSALSEVPYPPPPGRVEFVPKQPKTEAVWLDGEWIWQARRWEWKSGRWLVPPPGARFAPWTTVRDQTGTLFIASGTWRDRAGNEVAEPAPIVIAAGGLREADFLDETERDGGRAKTRPPGASTMIDAGTTPEPGPPDSGT